MEKSTNFSGLKLLLWIGLIGICIAAFASWYFYQQIYQSNVHLKEGESAYLYIPKGSSIEEVYASLADKNILKDPKFFEWVAERKNLSKHIYPGRYKITAGMSNNSICNLLRSGTHSPVKVTFNYLRTLEDLAGKVASYIDTDSMTLLGILRDPETAAKYNFTKETFPSMFLPNTYKFNWSANGQEFVARMNKEYKNFWVSRTGKAKAIDLTPEEVTTLASIVQSETAKSEERKRIAGVYMNRLQKGIPLEADPTLIFAMNDFTIKRVLDKHKEIDSPYNTYKNAGLPPGPINMPELSYIDAVLDYEKHNYIFFCAKEDFSGFSNFAENYNQHLKNARKYHQALNKRKIFR